MSSEKKAVNKYLESRAKEILQSIPVNDREIITDYYKERGEVEATAAVVSKELAFKAVVSLAFSAMLMFGLVFGGVRNVALNECRTKMTELESGFSMEKKSTQYYADKELMARRALEAAQRECAETAAKAETEYASIRAMCAGAR